MACTENSQRLHKFKMYIFSENKIAIDLYCLIDFYIILLPKQASLEFF